MDSQSWSRKNTSPYLKDTFLLDTNTSNTVNVDIFAQLNFRASSAMRHIRAVKFFVHMLFVSICSIVIIIFTHIKFSRI